MRFVVAVFVAFATLVVVAAQPLFAFEGSLDPGRLEEVARRVERRVSSPRAYPQLLRLFSLRASVLPSRYEEIIERLSRLRRADPGIAALIVRERARLLRGRGELEAARRLEEPLGVIRTWWWQPSAPPEQARAERPASARPDGLLTFPESSRASAEHDTYAVAYVWVPSGRPAALRFGASGELRVRVNGALVVKGRHFDRPVFDDDEVGIRLERGWNAIAFSMRAKRGVAGLIARLTSSAGGALAGLRVAAPDKVPSAREINAASKAPGRMAAPKLGPLSWWLGRFPQLSVERAGRLPIAPLARVCAAAGRVLPSSWSSERLAELLRMAPSPSVEAVLAVAALQPELPAKAAILAEALADEPGPFELVVAAADVERRRHRSFRALALLAALKQDRPAAVLVRASTYSDNQLYGDALHLLESMPEQIRETPIVQRTLAALDVERGATASAFERYRRLSLHGGDDAESLYWLAELGRSLGHREETREAFERFAALRPDLNQVLRDRALFLEQIGEDLAAESAWKALIMRFPDAAEVLEEVGAYYRRRGDGAQALGFWKESLALQPQNEELRLRMTLLAPVPESFEAPYVRDASQLASSFTAPQEGEEENDYISLLDQQVVHVFDNGAVGRYRAEYFHVLNPPTDDEARTHRIHYDPLRQRVDILDAFVISPDGLRRPPLSRRERRLSEAWYGAYYDLHVIELLFGALATGDTVVVTHRVVDLEPGPRAGSFGDVVFVQDSLPRREVEYVVDAPDSMNLHDRLVRPKKAPGFSVDRSDESSEGRRTIRYVLRDVEAAPVAEDGPGAAQRAAYLHVSSFDDAASLARWYARLAKDARRAGSAVQQAAREAVVGATGVLDRVRAVHRAVVERIRYVGLEFGIHGVVPYAARQVFHRRFGDCKDTSTLLSVMLEEVGIDARVAFVRNGFRGRVAERPASLAAFDHAIVYLPELDMWIDPTVREAAPGVLSPSLEGASALILGDAEGLDVRAAHVPVAGPEDDRATWRYGVTLRPDGSAELEARETWRGWRAAQLRAELRGSEERRRRVEKRMASIQPGIAVRELVVEGLEVDASELLLRYRAVLPNFAKTTARGLRFALSSLLPPFGTRVSRVVDSPKDGAERELPLVVPHRFMDEALVEVRLPRGWAPIADQGKKEELRPPFGHLLREVRTVTSTSASSLSFSLNMAVSAHELLPEQVKRFKGFCRAVDRALGEAYDIEPAAIRSAKRSSR